MKRISLVLISVLLSLVLVSCMNYESTGEVDAVVIDKEYKASYSSSTLMPMRIGKSFVMMPMPRHYPEKYLVRLEYKDMTMQVDNEELYNNIEVGDIVKVNYYKYGDKELIKYEE